MERNQPVAILAVTAKGFELGKTISRHLLSEARPCTLYGYRLRIKTENMFDNMGDCLKTLFLEQKAIIGIVPAAILIRLIAPYLNDKYQEAPLLAIDEEGHFIQPLLGNHHGGHILAKTIAQEIDATALITNASDARLGFSLDEPPDGWKISGHAHVKKLTGDLLSGKKPNLFQETESAWVKKEFFIDSRSEKKADIYIGVRNINSDILGFHPPLLTLGIGCIRGASYNQISDLVKKTLDHHQLSRHAIAAIASIDVKADEKGLIAFAEKNHWPLRFFSKEELSIFSNQVANPSQVVFEEVGCVSVAEAASLALAGKGAYLIAEKHKSASVTCAIAQSPTPLDPSLLNGKKRGRLAIIGLGPGGRDWQSLEVSREIAKAKKIIGYGLYLDLISSYAPQAEFLPYPIGEEKIRCQKALDCAANGEEVALVCSGDPGIYAMASLVFELLDKNPKPAWKFLSVDVCPGISAMHLLAARTGAPLGHDFCAISLSDLLTPPQKILERVEAAAQSDFIVSLYNPKSKSRTQLLEEVLKIFSKHRPPTTPVILGRHLGREGEEISITPIRNFSADAVDMFSTIIIGSTETRMLKEQAVVYTPRGYNKET